ncbi:hypothetical protein CEXT_120171 [Caerostris extrusa]|uniref:Uncharacterized protein n=1 Tax=Caerostris extrusa TaxID=172846 RepID=A0AAV4YD15_CAEEX|nr:hypothetical protein CEXT_120171 [Caerostris extrusa]
MRGVSMFVRRLRRAPRLGRLMFLDLFKLRSRMPEQTRLESRITMKGFSPDSRRGGGQGDGSAPSLCGDTSELANCSKYSVERRPGSLLPD